MSPAATKSPKLVAIEAGFYDVVGEPIRVRKREDRTWNARRGSYAFTEWTAYGVAAPFPTIASSDTFAGVKQALGRYLSDRDAGTLSVLGRYIGGDDRRPAPVVGTPKPPTPAPMPVKKKAPVVTLGKTEGPDGERSASILLDGVEIGSLETWKQINFRPAKHIDFSHVYVVLWEPYDYEGTFDADTYGDANTARRAALVAVRRYFATRDAAPLSAEEQRRLGKANAYALDWMDDGGTLPPEIDRLVNQTARKLTPEEGRRMIAWLDKVAGE